MLRNLTVFCLGVLLGSTMLAQQLQAGNSTCLTCHSAPGFSKSKNGDLIRPAYVDDAILSASVHKRKACIDCHTDYKSQALPHKKKSPAVNCARCHYSGNHAGAPYNSHIAGVTDSLHSSVNRKNCPDIPRCTDCHGSHNIRHTGDSQSMVSRTHVNETCGKCHLNPAFAQRHKLQNVLKYSIGVHAEPAGADHKLVSGAVCTDCHATKYAGPLQKNGSSVNRNNLAYTCGRCHKAELQEYKSSIHGIAAAQNKEYAPVCSDCHGSHQIVKSSSPTSPVYASNITATCSRCHDNAEIQRRYGLPASRLSSYMKSYHGIAGKYGNTSTANCASCHGSHAILPSKDSRSSINKQNLAKTCSVCHPGAGVNFADGLVHVIPASRRNVPVFWVRNLYILLIFGIIGSFCVYIILDIRIRYINRLSRRNGERR